MQGLRLYDFITDERMLRITSEPTIKARKKAVKCKKTAFKQCTAKTDYKQFDDFTVETKPRFTKHAQKRLYQGRQGKFICKPNKQKTTMCVVTVLPKRGKGERDDPSFSNDRMWNTHDIPKVKQTKKYTLQKKLDDYLKYS